MFRWKINNRIAELEDKPADIKNSVINIDTLLTMDLKMEFDELLEVTLSEMRIHTQIFQSSLNKQKFKHEINTNEETRGTKRVYLC